MAFDPKSAKPFNPSTAKPVGFNPATAKPFNPASAKLVEQPEVSPPDWMKQRMGQIEKDRQAFDAAGNDNTAPIQISETAGEVGGALKQAVVDPVIQSAELVGRGINETMRPVVGLKRATMMQPGEARTSAIKEIGSNATTDVSRGAADIATGALGVGINMMPAMAGVNLASSVARPLITDAVKKIGGSDTQVNIANKIFDYALAAKAFGYPVVRGMATGELFGKLADMGVNTEADWNNLNTEDKDRIINLAHNIGFFTGAGTEPTRVEQNIGRLSKRAGNYAAAKAEDAFSYIKPIRAEDAGYQMPSGNTSEGRSSTLEILGNELPAKGETSVPRASVINPIIATPGGQADVSKTFVSAERLDASKAAVDLPNVENRLTYIGQKIQLLKDQSKDAKGADREAIAKEISDLHAEKQVLSIQADNYRSIIAEVGQNIAPQRGGLMLQARNPVRPLAQADLAGVNTPDAAQQNYSIVPPEQQGANRPANSVLRPEQGPGVSRNQAVPEQKVFYPDNRINVNELAKVLREAEASNTLKYAVEQLMNEVESRGIQIDFAKAMEQAGAMNSNVIPRDALKGRVPEQLSSSTPDQPEQPIVFNVDEGRAKVLQDKLDRGMQLNAREIAERQKFEEAGIKFTEKPKAEAPAFNPESAKPVEPVAEKPVEQSPAEVKPVENAPLVPKFKNTQEALAFGKNATPEQLAELTRLREDALARAKALQDRYAAGEKKVAQEMINVGTEAQLYREALEAKGQKIEQKKPEKPIKPAKVEKPVSKKPVAPVSKGRIGRPKKYSQADENTYPIINSGFRIKPDWKLRDGKVSIVEEFEPIKDFLNLSNKPSKEQLMAAENGIIRGNIDQIAAEYAGEVGNPRYEDAENFRSDLSQEIDNYNKGGGFLNKEEINNLVEHLNYLREDPSFESEVLKLNPVIRERVLAQLQEIWKGELDAEQLKQYENDPEAQQLGEIENKILSATETGEIEDYLRLLDEVEGSDRPAGEPGARIENEVPPIERDRSGNVMAFALPLSYLGIDALPVDDERKKLLRSLLILGMGGVMIRNGAKWFLKSQKVLLESKQETFNPAQARALFKDIKSDEMKWTGLDDLLKDKEASGGKVTKAELQNVLDQENMKLEEVEKGQIAPVEWKKDGNEYVQDGSSDPEYVVLRPKYSDSEEYSVVVNGEIASEPMTLEEAKDFALREYLNDKKIDTKFNRPDLVTPGGTNYRELLMIMPGSTKTKIAAIRNKITNTPLDERAQAVYDKVQELQKATLHTSDPALSEQRDNAVIQLHKEYDRLFGKEYAEIDRLESEGKNVFNKSHWEEENVLAHTRFNDRMIRGGKSLHVEEFQSDWHRKGREEGYSGDNSKAQAELDKVIAEKKALYEEIVKKYGGYSGAPKDIQRKWVELGDKRDLLENSIKENSSDIPDAPFKKDWHEMAFRRMVRYAAENGYESLSWTTGKTQQDRYDLSKQVNYINASKMPADISDGGKYVDISTENSMINLEVDKNGIVVAQNGNKNFRDVRGAKLEEVIGKDAAKKVMESNEEDMRLQGQDLRVGGEWAVNLYDKALVNYANKFGKKFGAKVEDVETDGTSVHHMPITADMRATAKSEGMSMFSLLGGGLFLTNQLNPDDETKKKLDFVFGAMLMGGLGMALGSMKAKSIKSVADISEEAMKLYRDGKMKAEDVGPFMRSKMGAALDQADAKAGARVAKEIEDAIRKENDPKQGVRDAIQAGIKENLLSKGLRPDMQKMLRAVSEAHQKADIPGQNRLMFMDKIGGMRRQYGPAGTELQIQVLNGDIVRRDILNFGNERLNVVKDMYKDLDVDQRDEINKSVVAALEDRANADKHLDTAEKQKVYKNILSIFEYYKGLLREKGYKVIEEDYYTHIGKHDVIDQILQGEDLKDLNKPLDQFISEKSPYLKPRFDVEMEILKDLPKVITSYMRSVSKEIAYKDAVEYYRGDFRKDIPVMMQGRSMDLAFHNLKNSLNPQFAQGKLMKLTDQIRSNQYTNFLSYGLKQSAQNFTQRMLAEMYITPRAKEIYNRVYKYDVSGSKLADVLSQADKITPKQRKDLMTLGDDLDVEIVSPFVKKFRENDFFQRAELGNWHSSAAMGITNVIVNDPRFESTLEKNGGDAYKTINELLEDKDLAQKALREADVISMKTQVSPLPGSRMPANDYPLVRLFTSMKNFKLRYIQILTDIAKPMDGIGGFRAMKIIERGMNGEVIPVEVLRVVENTRKAVELEVKRVQKKGGKFKMEDGEEVPMQLAQDYLSFLKSKEKELNEVLREIEPAKKSNMLKTLAKYHAALFSISLAANILGNAADYAAYNVSGGAIGSQPDAEDVLNYAMLNSALDQSPMPFYRFDYPGMFRPIIFPNIGNSMASAMYNKGIPTKRAVARDLVPYAMNIVPFGGLIDRVTGRNMSRGIVNAIAPATPKKQSTSLQMIGGPGMPGMPK